MISQLLFLLVLFKNSHPEAERIYLTLLEDQCHVWSHLIDLHNLRAHVLLLPQTLTDSPVRRWEKYFVRAWNTETENRDILIYFCDGEDNHISLCRGRVGVDFWPLQNDCSHRKHHQLQQHHLTLWVICIFTKRNSRKKKHYSKEKKSIFHWYKTE